ncbi:uncharacterized [Tachysurus ichikawai]
MGDVLCSTVNPPQLPYSHKLCASFSLWKRLKQDREETSSCILLPDKGAASASDVVEVSGAHLNGRSNYRPACLAMDVENGEQKWPRRGFLRGTCADDSAAIVLLGNRHKRTGGVHLILAGSSQSERKSPRRPPDCWKLKVVILATGDKTVSRSPWETSCVKEQIP